MIHHPLSLAALVLIPVLALWAAAPATAAESPSDPETAETSGTRTPDAPSDGSDDPSSDDAGTPADNPATGKAAGEAAPAAQGDESPEVFIPSEEISEDFAVSFPVDI